MRRNRRVLSNRNRTAELAAWELELLGLLPRKAKSNSSKSKKRNGKKAGMTAGNKSRRSIKKALYAK